MVCNVRIRRAVPEKSPCRLRHLHRLRPRRWRLLIVEAAADGLTGYGEVSVLSVLPHRRNPRRRGTLVPFLIPIALQTDWRTPRARPFSPPCAGTLWPRLVWKLRPGTFMRVHGTPRPALGGTCTHRVGDGRRTRPHVDALLRTVNSARKGTGA